MQKDMSPDRHCTFASWCLGLPQYQLERNAVKPREVFTWRWNEGQETETQQKREDTPGPTVRAGAVAGWISTGKARQSQAKPYQLPWLTRQARFSLRCLTSQQGFEVPQANCRKPAP